MLRFLFSYSLLLKRFHYSRYQYILLLPYSYSNVSDFLTSGLPFIILFPVLYLLMLKIKKKNVTLRRLGIKVGRVIIHEWF